MLCNFNSKQQWQIQLTTQLVQIRMAEPHWLKAKRKDLKKQNDRLRILGRREVNAAWPIEILPGFLQKNYGKKGVIDFVRDVITRIK